MDTRFVEVTNGEFNWGKFLVARLDHEEVLRPSVISPEFGSLIRQRGWSKTDILVLDLETCEGAVFSPRGTYARGDLKKHQIWVCPMFEPFLGWLYQQDLTDLSLLPDSLDLPDAKFMAQGHRRTGPEDMVLRVRQLLFDHQEGTLTCSELAAEIAETVGFPEKPDATT